MCMKTRIKKEENRIFNEKTGKYEWVWVDVTHYRHEAADRELAVLDFLHGDISVGDVVAKHHISNEQTLFSWIGRYMSEHNLLSLDGQSEEDMTDKSKDEQIRELEMCLKKA